MGDRDRDRGQILTLVLAFVVFAGLVTPSVLMLATTGLRTSTRIQAQRDERYAAAAAVDTHIEFLRQNPSLGSGTTPCPSSTSTLNGVTVSLTCSNVGTTSIGRDLVIVARASESTALTAQVFIDPLSQNTVYVNYWSYAPA
jgi:Tfp pilus assembly protein PilX